MTLQKYIIFSVSENFIPFLFENSTTYIIFAEV